MKKPATEERVKKKGKEVIFIVSTIIGTLFRSVGKIVKDESG